MATVRIEGVRGTAKQRFRASESSRAAAMTAFLPIPGEGLPLTTGELALMGMTRMGWCAGWEKHNCVGGLLLPVARHPQCVGASVNPFGRRCRTRAVQWLPCLILG